MNIALKEYQKMVRKAVLNVVYILHWLQYEFDLPAGSAGGITLLLLI